MLQQKNFSQQINNNDFTNRTAPDGLQLTGNSSVAVCYYVLSGNYLVRYSRGEHWNISLKAREKVE